MGAPYIYDISRLRVKVTKGKCLLWGRIELRISECGGKKDGSPSMMTATVEFVRYFTAYDGITYMAHCLFYKTPII